MMTQTSRRCIRSQLWLADNLLKLRSLNFPPPCPLINHRKRLFLKHDVPKQARFSSTYAALAALISPTSMASFVGAVLRGFFFFFEILS